jgi:hypothetical protein
MALTVHLKKEWTNPLFFEIQKWVDDPEIDTIMIYGGKSSAKTFTISQFLLADLVTYGRSSLAYRKEATTLGTTLKKTMDTAMESLRFEQVVKPQDYKFQFKGKEIALKGLDREGKVKGIEGYQYIFWDEADHFTKEEYDQAQVSLRGLENQKFFLSWNPINTDIWIKKEVVDKEVWHRVENTDLTSYTHEVHVNDDGNMVLIKVTYEDNHWTVGSPDGTYGFRDERLLRRYEKLKVNDPDSYQVNVLGNYGYLRNDDPWLYTYDQRKNILDDDLPMVDGQVVWLSYDFNFDPTTCTVYQILPYGHTDRPAGIYLLKEFAVKGGTSALCDAMLLDKELMDSHTGMWNITGDTSGSSRSSVAGTTTDYDIIQDKFGIPDGSFYSTVKRNKDFALSRKLCNYFTRNVPFYINPSCQLMAKGMRIAKPKEGQGDKLFKDAKKGYGMDLFDSFRYFVGAKFFETKEMDSFVNLTRTL